MLSPTVEWVNVFPVSCTTTLMVYCLMIPLWSSVCGGDQERSTEVEVTAVYLTNWGVSLGSGSGIKDTVVNDNQRLCIAFDYIRDKILIGTVVLNTVWMKNTPSSIVRTEIEALKGPLTRQQLQHCIRCMGWQDLRYSLAVDSVSSSSVSPVTSEVTFSM